MQKRWNITKTWVKQRKSGNLSNEDPEFVEMLKNFAGDKAASEKLSESADKYRKAMDATSNARQGLCAALEKFADRLDGQPSADFRDLASSLCTADAALQTGTADFRRTVSDPLRGLNTRADALKKQYDSARLRFDAAESYVEGLRKKNDGGSKLVKAERDFQRAKDDLDRVKEQLHEQLNERNESEIFQNAAEAKREMDRSFSEASQAFL